MIDFSCYLTCLKYKKRQLLACLFCEKTLPEEQKRMLKEAQDKAREFLKQFKIVYIKKKN